MPLLWIVDREPRRRAAIARLAAAPEDAVLAGPGEPEFDQAPPADVVLLGLGAPGGSGESGGDLEIELQFAHRANARLPGAHWFLLVERRDVERARRLFDTLDAEILVYPPEARHLRRSIGKLRGAHAADSLPLSRRPQRDALSERFGRWFGDLEVPELLRALDPRLTGVSLLIEGESGSGRGLLARYIHTFGGTAGGELIPVSCTAETRTEDIAQAIARSAAGSQRPSTVWLEDVERLALPVQRDLRGWIEFAPPPPVSNVPVARWIASAAPGAVIDPGLRRALSELILPVPPLRERPHTVGNVVLETARAWCAARSERPRRFDETAILALEEYPWPGNLRELEALVVETLAAVSTDPIRAGDLLLDGEPFAPIGALEVDALLDPERDLDLDLHLDRELRSELESQLESSHDSELEADLEDLDLLSGVIPEVVPAEILGEAEFPVAEVLAADEDAPVPPGDERDPVTDDGLRRLAGAVAHEVRNPLTAIRTFAQLLPEKHADEDFRTRFAELVGQGVVRIEDVVERLSQLAELEPPRIEKVDVAALLEGILDQRRDAIRDRRLLVLKEIDTNLPTVFADRTQLRLAFEALLDESIHLVPDHGNVYIASKHHAAGLAGEPSVRILVRFHGHDSNRAEAAGEPIGGVTEAENAIAFTVAETIIRAQHGALALDATDSNETVIVLDLPAPA